MGPVSSRKKKNDVPTTSQEKLVRKRETKARIVVVVGDLYVGALIILKFIIIVELEKHQY